MSMRRDGLQQEAEDVLTILEATNATEIVLETGARGTLTARRLTTSKRLAVGHELATFLAKSGAKLA